MATQADTDLHRIVPIQGGEVARRRLEDHGGRTPSDQMQAGEVHTSVDALGFARIFVAHKHVGGYLPHGDVATEAAMLALDNPGAAHACLPGDTCRRTDLAGSPVMLCISGHGTLAADWLSLGGAGAAGGGGVWGAITGTLGDQTDLAAALAALTTALGGKAATTHTHAQSDVTGLSTVLAGKSKVLIAGSGVALADTPDGVVVSVAYNGNGSALITAICATSFAGISHSEVAADSTGFGWAGDATPYVVDWPMSTDNFAGITSGAEITSWAGGTGWAGPAIPYTI